VIRWFAANRVSAFSTAILLLGIAVAWAAYSLFGHRLIEAMYKAKSIVPLNGLMKGRAFTPLENYYEAADKALWNASFTAVVLFFVIAVLIKARLLNKLLLMFSSFFIISFLLFCVVELFPSLIKFLHLYPVHYYAVKDYFEADDKLVYREKPFYYGISHDSRGDKYSPLYGVDVLPMTVEWRDDEDGFRNNTTTGLSDVVVMGDSYIASGLNGDDMFGKRLERASGLTVTGLGVEGYGPFQYLEVLKRYGLKRKPKYALFSFFEGNDISDIREYQRWSGVGITMMIVH
jgi:hypothetical protein